jgi:hypothetical protein
LQGLKLCFNRLAVVQDSGGQDQGLLQAKEKQGDAALIGARDY